jgi:hypothetical protein
VHGCFNASQGSQNWWFQAIGDALPVAQLTLQYGAWLSPAQASNATYLLAQSTWQSWSKTGTNAVDIGKVRLTLGVITGNVSMVSEAFDVIYSTFQYADQLPPNSPEGPKKDGVRARAVRAIHWCPLLIVLRITGTRSRRASCSTARSCTMETTG